MSECAQVGTHIIFVNKTRENQLGSTGEVGNGVSEISVFKHMPLQLET